MLSGLIARLRFTPYAAATLGPLLKARMSIARYDVDLPHHPLGLRPNEIDREQPLREFGALDLHALGKDKGALELPGGDAAMQIVPHLLLFLPAADQELVLLDRDLDLVLRECGHGKRNAQSFRLAAVRGDPLDIVGRIAIRPGL